MWSKLLVVLGWVMSKLITLFFLITSILMSQNALSKTFMVAECHFEATVETSVSHNSSDSDCISLQDCCNQNNCHAKYRLKQDSPTIVKTPINTYSNFDFPSTLVLGYRNVLKRPPKLSFS